MKSGSNCVFVIGINGKRLMPTSPRKARLLLKAGKATVYQRRPYTIQLHYKTGGNVQECALAFDTGSQHIGVGLVRLNRKEIPDGQAAGGTRTVTTATGLCRAEIQLRSTIEKRKLMETRKTYRRGRRYRNVRYRHPKYPPRSKRVYQEKLLTRKSTKHKTHWKIIPNKYESSRPEGWLPSAIQSKVDQHKNWINAYWDVVPEGTHLIIEKARFDIQHAENPEIRGVMYQQGPLYEYENVRAYVFARDKYTCGVCGCKLGTTAPNGRVRKGVVHHILLKKEGATDSPKWLRCVCDYCHKLPHSHEPGTKIYDWFLKGKPINRVYRDASFMNILGKRLQKAFPQAEFTFGNVTKVERERYCLPKTHANDAMALAAYRADTLVCNCGVTLYKQVRSKKRSLHEATPRKGRKEPNRTAQRNSKNTRRSGVFQIWDKVLWRGQVGWISGFANNGSCVRLVDMNGHFIHPSNKAYSDGQVPTLINISEIRLLYHNNNWIISTQSGDSSRP